MRSSVTLRMQRSITPTPHRFLSTDNDAVVFRDKCLFYEVDRWETILPTLDTENIDDEDIIDGLAQRSFGRRYFRGHRFESMKLRRGQARLVKAAVRNDLECRRIAFEAQFERYQGKFSAFSKLLKGERKDGKGPKLLKTVN